MAEQFALAPGTAAANHEVSALAAAAGPAERRQLKLARQPDGAEAPITQAAKEARRGAGADAVAAAGRGAAEETSRHPAVSLAHAAAVARAKAVEAAEQAELAMQHAVAAQAAVAKVGLALARPLALATTASVWITFDGIPPDEEIQQVLAGGRGEWLMAGDVPEPKLQSARRRMESDAAPDRWARGPQLVLPVCRALKDLGVAQGLGAAAKDTQAARTRTALERLQWVVRLGLARPALRKLVGGSALTAGLRGAACHVYDSDTLSTMRKWVTHALCRGSHFAQAKLSMHLVLPYGVDRHRALRKTPGPTCYKAGL